MFTTRTFHDKKSKLYLRFTRNNSIMKMITRSQNKEMIYRLEERKEKSLDTDNDDSYIVHSPLEKKSFLRKLLYYSK